MYVDWNKHYKKQFDEDLPKRFEKFYRFYDRHLPILFDFAKI